MLGGFSILFMLTVEYKESKKLIINNQFLMKNTVIKTMAKRVSEQLNNYPDNLNDLHTNWRKLPLNISISHKNQWIFPKRFSGKMINTPSQLWEAYKLEGELEKMNNELQPETRQRVEILNQINISLKTKNPTDTSKLTKTYFNLLENYHLSAIEEIISRLAFLQLGEKYRWNNQLIDLLVFQGYKQLPSISDYIFQQNNKLSIADIKLSISKTQSILENTNINSDWFNQSAQALWKTDLAINSEPFKHLSLIDNQLLYYKTKENLAYLVPFNIENELKEVEKILKSQSILGDEDTISIKDNLKQQQRAHPIEDLDYIINHSLWKKQHQQQTQFFIIKAILSITFILSLIITVIFITYRNKKKIEFINLRENFINLVSHELKTPLASIRIMIETLQKRNNRKLSIKNYPEKIISEVDRLWLMVDNLLSLNQIKSGKLNLNITQTNLTQLFNRVYANFKENSSVELNVNNKLPEKFYSQFDPILFELVFINLFSNAIKYCKHPQINIEISINKEQNQLYFTDNACGIPTVLWNEVFDDFYREDINKSKQGTGIGLSLCKQIMNIHQGDIAIKNSSDAGTCWMLTLPKIEKGS
ncbi:sensor histidine kinase [Aliikangiella sp. IMCC44359]|uniref:sensor histidine kinase n=1 Tax=Aliikangiella sp. IMCC44359 TaxID=3459125 RepID=UPI00403ADD57